MKELLVKLSKAKADIKALQLSKEGENTYSNYNYFTPSQVEGIVAKVCQDNGLLTTFDLSKNELGYNGVLTIYDTESGKNLKLNMATDIPQIKATNTAQQLGGCVTYTERYLKMSAFGITDNRLDFDTTENTKSHKNAVSEAEKTENWKKVINQKAELVANANKDFVNDVLVYCAIDSLQDAYDTPPSERKKVLGFIDDQIIKIKENK